jgi:cation transport ATPase
MDINKLATYKQKREAAIRKAEQKAAWFQDNLSTKGFPQTSQEEQTLQETLTGAISAIDGFMSMSQKQLYSYEEKGLDIDLEQCLYSLIEKCEFPTVIEDRRRAEEEQKKRKEESEREKQRQIRRERRKRHMKFAIWLFSGFFILSAFKAFFLWLREEIYYFYSLDGSSFPYFRDRLVLSLFILPVVFFGGTPEENIEDIWRDNSEIVFSVISSSLIFYKILYWGGKKYFKIEEIFSIFDGRGIGDKCFLIVSLLIKWVGEICLYCIFAFNSFWIVSNCVVCFEQENSLIVGGITAILLNLTKWLVLSFFR